VRIAFVHFPGRLARLDAARAGDGPTEFLFGAVELERAGHDVVHYEVDPDLAAGRMSRLAVDYLAGLGHLPAHLRAGVLGQTRRLLPDLRGADVVVATTTATAMALGVWRLTGLFRRPLVGVLAGLLNRPWYPSRRLTTLALLRRMHIVLYGQGELDGVARLDRRLGGRIHVVPFGVDAEYWTPAHGGGDGVVAIGNDGHRDWETLVGAAAGIGARIAVLTSHPAPAELPANVTWRPADWHRRLLSDDEIRASYRAADVVVVPVRDVPQPSGQSVTLQAMACGRPVVLSRTRGLWEPEALHDGENVVLVEPGNRDALAAAVRTLLDEPERAAAIGAAARTDVAAHASVEQYAQRLERVCRLAIDRP
jgi:glycosyltransferase involved in cell wall biosynthesis